MSPSNYYEDCPACSNPVMRITEARYDPETIVRSEDCSVCHHQDTYSIMVDPDYEENDCAG